MKSLLFVLGLVGCHSHVESRLSLEAPRSRYPVSLSDGLADDKGLIAPTRMHEVGALSFATDGCVKTSLIDLSQVINDQVTKAGGDGVIHFTLVTKQDTDCIDAKASGDIVKVDP